VKELVSPREKYAVRQRHTLRKLPCLMKTGPSGPQGNRSSYRWVTVVVEIEVLLCVGHKYPEGITSISDAYIVGVAIE